MALPALENKNFKTQKQQENFKAPNHLEPGTPHAAVHISNPAGIRGDFVMMMPPMPTGVRTTQIQYLNEGGAWQHLGYGPGQHLGYGPGQKFMDVQAAYRPFVAPLNGHV